ncbi:nitrate- and nitrite sensing domain-containing protein [Streptomyces albus]|uniref:sensor histidine kinase n=1 Tax=Streptomyces albus TaxID=1888 RepID=UPI0004C5A412|nr:nitrate- and nitrite sensing domain-containing protein [Streptomyces albus]
MQGRFKRDSSAAADPELHGGADRGLSSERAQGPGATPGDHGSDRGAPTQGQGGGDGSGTPDVPHPSAGTRLALRNWRISTRLVSLLALPVVAATTLGALRIDTSMDDLDQLENMQLLTEMTKQATELASALQEERDHSAGPLAAGDKKNDDVVYPRQQTDRAKQAFREATQEIESSDDDSLVGVNSSLVNILKQLEQIKQIRSNAYADSEYIALTVYQYNQLITSLLSLSQDMAQATSNTEMIRATRALAAFSSAKEYASIQRAMITAALANEPKPKLVASDRLYGESALLSEESTLAQFSQIYDGKQTTEELLQALEDGGSANIILADKYAARMLKPDSPIANETRSYKDWYDQDTAKIEEMSKIEATLLSEMEDKARELRSEAQRDALLNGLVILLVLGVSLVGAFVVARSMVRSLRRLQDTAQEVSQKRLPELVKQLSDADPQDVDTSVTSVGVHSKDEIGRVAAAFDDVHREAVRLAAEQALLRGNVNAMFTNLSRRSQGLIQRQLSLISELESREADPDQLSSLFKLDHLATRMRRNGENLLVLAGEEPGRRWTRPVPLVDVLRAAASEVEQYERIELSSVPSTEVAGRVVNDLVHLLAELLENATSFSSPQTKVKVTGHALPDGRVLVEIHDTGIGLSPEDLADINERLASPPTVDVSVSRRMGLFVVGRLSQRHGIRIQLRPSDSGGTTALVMLPVDVAQSSRKTPGNKPNANPASQGSGAGTGGPQGNRLAGMAPRGQMPGGGRPALPGRDGAPSGGPGGRPDSGPPPQRPQQGGGPAYGDPSQGQGRGGPGGPGGNNIFGAPAPGAGAPARQAAPDDRPDRPRPALPQQGAGPGASQPPVAPPTGAPRQAPGRGPAGQGPRAQIPPRGPAGELPGGPPRPQSEQRPAEPAGTSWGARRSSGDDWPGSRSEPPRGHEEAESTAQFPRPDFTQPPGAPQQQRPPAPQQWQDTGQYPAPHGQGRPPVRSDRDPGDTAQFPRPGHNAPQPGAQQPGAAQQPPQRAPQQRRAEPEALPPASGPGDGRTPLFEALESDWFRGIRGGRPGEDGEEPQPRQEPQPRREQPAPASVPPPPQRREASRAESPGGNGAVWRSSPNDELGRQAERVRQPAAGGLTTSGLPRRVPRANLVAGTAQQPETIQPGPQVSRAPADVRGRLTNLRRGIQQGRQAGHNPGPGEHGIGPTYHQER